MDEDYYAILGVHPSAEEAVIRAAYRALAKLYHPDLCKADDVAERMAKINEAYTTLSDEEKRKEYDSSRSNSLPEDDPIFDNTEYNDEEFFGEAWSLAREYYPEAAREAEELSKISTKLAFTYKAFLIDTKSFGEHTAVFERFREEFLFSYFGKNEYLQIFARRLIINRDGFDYDVSDYQQETNGNQDLWFGALVTWCLCVFLALLYLLLITLG